MEVLRKAIIKIVLAFSIFLFSLKANSFDSVAIVNVDINQLRYITKYDLTQMILGRYRFWYNGSVIKLVVYKNPTPENSRYIIFNLGIPLSYYRQEIHKAMRYDSGRFYFIDRKGEMVKSVSMHYGAIGYIDRDQFIVLDRYRNVIKVDIR